MFSKPTALAVTAALSRQVLAFGALVGLGACAQFEGLLPTGQDINDPVGIAVHPSGRYVYVVNSNFNVEFDVAAGGHLTVIDADTLVATTDEPWHFGSYGARVSLGGDDPANPDSLAVAVRGTGDVQVLRVTEDGRRVTCPGGEIPDDCSVAIGRDPYAVVPVPRQEGTPSSVDSWMVASLDGQVTLVSIANDDPRTSTAAGRGIQSGANVLAALPSTGEILMASRFGTRIYTLTWFHTVEGEAGGVLPGRSLNLPTPGDRVEMRDVAFSSDGERAWLTGQSPSALYTIDIRPDGRGLARNTLLSRVDLDGAPADLIAVNEQGRDILYVALADDEAIAVIDGATGVTLDRIELTGLAFGLAWDGVRHQRLYVTLFDSDSVGVIDLNPTSPFFRTVVAVIQ
jgi:DNA-binding beta-propeller fold protein YncE